MWKDKMKTLKINLHVHFFSLYCPSFYFFFHISTVLKCPLLLYRLLNIGTSAFATFWYGDPMKGTTPCRGLSGLLLFGILAVRGNRWVLDIFCMLALFLLSLPSPEWCSFHLLILFQSHHSLCWHVCLLLLSYHPWLFSIFLFYFILLQFCPRPPLYAGKYTLSLPCFDFFLPRRSCGVMFGCIFLFL